MDNILFVSENKYLSFDLSRISNVNDGDFVSLVYIIHGFCLDSDRYAYRATESLFLPIRHDITVAIGIGIDVYNRS